MEGNAEKNVEAGEKMKIRRGYQYFASLTATLGCLSMGFVSAYPSTAIPSLKSPGSGFHITNTQASLIAGLFSMGSVFGNVLSGPLMNYFGRKRMLTVLPLLYLTGWALIGSAIHVYMILAGRAITGFAAGIAIPVATVYISEISEPAIRGRLASFVQLLGTLGIVLSYTAGGFLDWYQLALTSLACPIWMLLCVPFVPSSPRWLLMQGREKEARKAMRCFRGDDYDINDEIMDIKGTLKFMKENNISTASILTGVAQLAGNICVCGVLDKLGRKFLLQVSSAVMAASWATLGVYSYLHEQNPSMVEDFRFIPLVSMVVFMFFFALGYRPIPNVITGEVLPTSIRDIGGGITTSVNFIFIYVCVFTYLYLVDWINPSGAYTIYMFTSILAFLYPTFYLPETKGKTLEEIEQILMGDKLDKIMMGISEADGHKRNMDKEEKCFDNEGYDEGNVPKVIIETKADIH